MPNICPSLVLIALFINASTVVTGSRLASGIIIYLYMILRERYILARALLIKWCDGLGGVALALFAGIGVSAVSFDC